MKENSIRRAVREGRAALGTGLKEFASRGVPWIIEEAGFDYCAIDHEHGAFDMETIANLATWFQATNVTAIVRIPVDRVARWLEECRGDCGGRRDRHDRVWAFRPQRPAWGSSQP